MQKPKYKVTDESKKTGPKVVMPKMGTPTGNYTPMERYLREYEDDGKMAPDLVVDLMEEFQKMHVEKKHQHCSEQEIARLSLSNGTIYWFGCQTCGNVRQRRGAAR